MTTMLRGILLITFASICSLANAQYYLDVLNDSGDMTYEEIVDSVEAHFDKKGRTKHLGYKQFLRWKYFAKRNLDSQRRVISPERTSASYEAFLEKEPKRKMNASNWTELGPVSATNTSTWSSHIGRISNIGIDPNNDNHIIVTSPGGGVWKTLDEGATWTPIFDNQTSLNCWSAFISSSNSNIYLVGTSGIGVRRSTDGGATWNSVSGIGGTVYTIKEHPNSANILFAVSSNGSVYRSTDTGSTWTLTYDINTTLYDLEFKPDDPNIIYVSGRSGNLHRSLNNGLSFSPVTGPWATRSLMMATTPHNPDLLYVLQENGGGYGGLFISRDSANTWQTQSTNGTAGNIMGYNLNENGGQAPRDMDVVVSPTDSNEVHVAGIMTFKSINKGVDWTQTTHWVISNPLPFVHADIDQVIYHSNGKIYVASDGGLFISSDAGSSFVDKTTGLGIRQFYRISVSSTESARVNGGSQDNGTGILRGGTWYDWLGADGMEPLILDHDEDVVFGSIQFGSLRKSTNGGDSSNGSVSQTEGGANGNWVTPLEKDPVQQNVIYQAKKHLYKSIDGGLSWETISDVNPGNGNQRIDEVAIAPNNGNVIYIAYPDNVFKTVDGGANWTDVTPGLNINSINYISVHPTDENKVLISTSGAARVLESTDGGSNWNNITHNLPNLGTNCAIYDRNNNNGIYVSQTRGVYFKDNSSPTSYTTVASGLPNVNITELEIMEGKLYAATYGRGLWAADIPDPAHHINANVLIDTCISNNTQDPTDDLYAFSVSPGGLGLGNEYNVAGDVNASNVPYGTRTNFDDNGQYFPVSAGQQEVTVSDVSTPSCFKIFAVPLPANCFRNSTCDASLVLLESGTYEAIGPSSGNGATQNNATHATWFYFVPPIDGKINVASCGGGVDTRLNIHSGDCENLSLITSVDDNCSMGNGLSNYASSVQNLDVIGGTTYYIEWDNRWSGTGFDFLFEYIPKYSLEECAEQTIVTLDNLASDTYRASEKVVLKGTASESLIASSKGIVEIDEQMNFGANTIIEILKDTCIVNDTTDWRIIGGGGAAITDQQQVDITLDVPSEILDTIKDVNIELDLTHTYLGDLTIDLIAPDGTTVRLWDRYCGGDDNLKIIIDEDAATKALCGSDWILGKPIQSIGSVPKTTLDVYNDKLSGGSWIIRINDLATGDTGTVNRVALHFTSN